MLGNPSDEPANFADRFGFSSPPSGSELWSDVWSSFRNWLQQSVPEYDLESGVVVRERPRWQAIAPYVGIPAAAAVVFGVEAFAPAVAAWPGLGGGAAEVGADAAVEGPQLFGSFPLPENLKFGTTEFGFYAHEAIGELFEQTYSEEALILRTGRGQVGVDVEVVEQEWIDIVGFRYGEIKPLSASGESRFNVQVLNWDLPAPVQPITYDAAGNVYLGFR